MIIYVLVSIFAPLFQPHLSKQIVSRGFSTLNCFALFQCDSLVAAYLPEIMQLLSQELSPDFVCKVNEINIHYVGCKVKTRMLSSFRRTRKLEWPFENALDTQKQIP